MLQKAKRDVLQFFSLEMSSQSLTSRMLGSMANINQQEFMVGNLNERHWEKFMIKAQSLVNSIYS